MPFVRTQVHADSSAQQRAAIVAGIHDALVESIGMPPDELFNALSEYRDGQFHFSRSFNGIARSQQVVVIEITLRRGRSDAMKRDLYARIAANLAQHAEVAPADTFIFLHENDYSDWSVGGGVAAMALVQQTGGVERQA